MSRKNTHSVKNSLLSERLKTKDTKESEAKQLFAILHKKPISRRMSATYLGYTDQTYMVTQTIVDWIKSGKAQVVGKIKCKRSQKIVEAVTTNSAFFITKENQQLELFE
jgi:hypothetical protein